MKEFSGRGWSFKAAVDFIGKLKEEGEKVFVSIKGKEISTNKEISFYGEVVGLEKRKVNKNWEVPYILNIIVDSGFNRYSVGGSEATMEDIAATKIIIEE